MDKMMFSKIFKSYLCKIREVQIIDVCRAALLLRSFNFTETLMLLCLDLTVLDCLVSLISSYMRTVYENVVQKDLISSRCTEIHSGCNL